MARYQGEYYSNYDRAKLTLSQYISQTFGWMFLGLLVTFVLAAALAYSGAAFFLASFPAVVMILLAAEILVVIFLSSRVRDHSVGFTRFLFTVYSILNGLVFSVIFLVYDFADLVIIFGMTAVFFGAFAAYGRFTKTDLSNLRPLLVGSLIFLIVSGIILLFLDLPAMEKIICMIGIVVFLCFTAYDTQKIKKMYISFQRNDELLQKASIFSALELYLDFVNLFLYLLRFLGKGSSSSRR